MHKKTKKETGEGDRGDKETGDGSLSPLGALYFRRRRKVKYELHTDNKREHTENGMLSFMVEVWRFELQASSTRNWRATNCATPRKKGLYTRYNMVRIFKCYDGLPWHPITLNYFNIYVGFCQAFFNKTFSI